MMKEKEFNLLYEPWIAVINEDGSTEEVGLINAFKRAHLIKMLSGELPTQDVAILRLLLAVMYAVFLRKDVNGHSADIKEAEEAFGRWNSIWSLGHFPLDVVETYLKGYEERFYLIHPQRPFYQAHIDKGTEYGVAKLIGDISESGNKARLFSTRSGDAKERIGLAETARWLIYVNAYDDTSAKPSVRGQNMPSVGAGWLGKLGLVYAKGETLFETLMLNFITWDRIKDKPFPRGEAIWESETPSFEERREVRTPDNPLSLLTIQSRRLMLLRDEAGVIGYRLLGGDVFPKENAFIEHMTLWRANKDSNGGEFVPKRHDPAKALWRDFSSLLAAQAVDKNSIPGVVKWISKLHEECVISPDKMVTFQTASVKYGDKDFFVDDVFSDKITVNANLLTKIESSMWIDRITDAVSKTDKCVWRFGRFAMDTAKAGGDDDENNLKGVSENAREDAFFKLDVPFRKWLMSINPEECDLELKLKEWYDLLKKTLFDCGEKILSEAGDRALVGSSEKMSAFAAYRSFIISVNKIIRGG